MAKVEQLNKTVESFQALSDSEMKQLAATVAKAKKAAEKATASTSITFSSQELNVLPKLLEWPVEKIFPALDLTRLLLMAPKAAMHLCGHMKLAVDDLNVLAKAVDKIRERRKPVLPVYMLLLRLMVNLFASDEGKEVARSQAKVLLHVADECLALDQPALVNPSLKLLSKYAISAYRFIIDCSNV